MLFVKTLIRTLATSLCLLLVVASPGVAGEASFESLPVGAKARLGQGEIWDAQYSPDGTRLAIGSSVGIWLYDTQTYETTSLLTGHTYGAVSVAFSPDGRTLTSGSTDGIRLLDAATGSLQLDLFGISGNPQHPVRVVSHQVRFNQMIGRAPGLILGQPRAMQNSGYQVVEIRRGNGKHGQGSMGWQMAGSSGASSRWAEIDRIAR